ncbi:MAG TPA: chemotaxis protein CheW [Ignavibacteria bacterium]|nr:chemotaxis protein CheW [Ignavibacteria bacterium]
MQNLNENNEESSELLQLVSFMIDREEFGVNILCVQEINRLMQITKVPNVPDFVEGVINLRGRVIPVIDLRTKLKIQKKDRDNNTRIIVVEIEEKTIGFIVDSVKEVLRIPTSITEAPPEMVTGIDSDYIMAVAKLDDRLITLLNLEKILSNTEKEELQDVEQS